LARQRNGVRRLIDAEDFSVRPDERGGEQADITRSAADVEDAHAWREARARKDDLGEITDEPRLQDQAAMLVAAVAEYISLASVLFHIWSPVESDQRARGAACRAARTRGIDAIFRACRRFRNGKDVACAWESRLIRKLERARSARTGLRSPQTR